MEKVVKDAGAGKKKVSTRQLVSMAMLGAISIVLVSVVHFPLIPAAAFLEYDPADIPILIGTFAYGPLAGLLMTIVVSIIQGVTVSAQSGPIGVVMHISLPASAHWLPAAFIAGTNRRKPPYSHLYAARWCRRRLWY